MSVALCNLQAFTVLCAAGLCCINVAAHADTPPENGAAFIDTWCIDCHSGAKPKGKFSLEDAVDRLKKELTTEADRSILRKAVRRIADGEMPPPASDPQPPGAERTAAIHALRSKVILDRKQIIVTSGPPRRLNRAEYANTIRDLFAIDVAPLGALPPDDVGAGFDNIGSVLSLAPITFERLVEIAEAIAAQAAPEASSTAPVKIVIDGKSMEITKEQGVKQKNGALLWSNGEARTKVDLPRTGRYAITSRIAGQQAGPDPVRMSLLAGKNQLAEFTVEEIFSAPGSRRIEVPLRAGAQTISVTFNNDFFQKGEQGKPNLDRNALVCGVTIEGPLDAYELPAWRQSLDTVVGTQTGNARRNTSADWLIQRILRRPATAADRNMLHRVTDSLDLPYSYEGQLRTMITALLVHPEFLFRIEAQPTAEIRARELTPQELAVRLSYFIWASCPDESLAHDATNGNLDTTQDRQSVVNRMLADPKSSSLAERFATQWLAIDGLDQKMPDPTQFPGIDAQLLRSMRQESVFFFNSVLREGRPAQTILDADYTFVDARLAKHYGMPIPTTVGMNRVPVDPTRGGGVLAHASVLTATSNPTRTSPVKRGKWVLDSILGAPPPPPPPGTPQIPDRAADRGGKSMRELLEIHRADANCASCHTRMDAIGFAFEAYDPVGRLREKVDGRPVETQGTLPSGFVITGLDGIRTNLRDNPAFIRSLVQHLMTYAIGCAPNENTEDEIDFLCENLSARPTLADIVHAITESPSFRMRGAQ